MLRSNDDDNDDDEQGESDTDNQSVFDLTAPSPAQLPRQYSVDLMLETYDWKEMESTHPGCLSLELRREFNRLENTLVPITENQLEHKNMKNPYDLIGVYPIIQIATQKLRRMSTTKNVVVVNRKRKT